MEMEDRKKLEALCIDIRKAIAKYGFESGRGHVSSALSLVEILVALYFGGGVDIYKIQQNKNDRDRVVLSKGHGGLALYLTLVKAGIIKEESLCHFASAGGRLSTHPEYGSVLGVEMSAGSLGQGIGFACGIALSGKIRREGYHVFVIVGDGELQEGSNWESMLFASQMGLSGLTIIVDRNQLQISGKVDDIISLSPLGQKLMAFGFETIEVEGHNVESIVDAIQLGKGKGPKAIIAHTVKGKGFSWMENENGWHGKGLSEDEYRRAMRELGGIM